MHHITFTKQKHHCEYKSSITCPQGQASLICYAKNRLILIVSLFPFDKVRTYSPHF